MIWILYIVGGLIGLLVVMALIGLTLRRDHLAARTAVFPRPPAELYALIREPTWRKDKDQLPFVVDEDTPPTRYITRISDDKLPFGGRWIYVLTPDGAGTRLTITEDGFVKNPLFRFLSRTVFSLTSTMDHYLRDLGNHLGADITPAPADPQR